ncbi:iron dicitrate transporter FecR [Nitrospira sp. KM1]|uniref:FecR family protein n=1 Tax=Nitrospira sp. KM1 TaxID=1936990 RepID=UPI0013A78576|nr:FecR domain-containing protein [Nitrospira sp. KM1]BCA56583.1 iron dicitrate transporter FecR [Nitrospira sp. KM1]
MTEEETSRQALDWLIALHDRPDDHDIRERFEVWLTINEANGKAWADAWRLWKLIGETPPAHADAWAPRPASSIQIDSPAVVPDRANRRSSRHIRYWRPAALAAGLAACLFFALPNIRIYWHADHRTGIGESAQVTLSDGSIMHLAADTAVRVIHDPMTRGVELLKGEAFFEVKPDSSRPFQVKASEWTTTVLGTAFDVNLGSQTASVAVEQGNVRVDRTGEGPSVEQSLEVGDWIRVERGRGVTAQGHGQPSQVAAWRLGRLIVKSRSISDVIGELERYHRGVILVTDPRLKSRLVSGVYDLRQPIEALRAVVQPHRAVVREVTPYLIIVSAS